MNSLQLSHHYWSLLLAPADIVIDATCGNGKDTLALARLVPEGLVFSMDIQRRALEETCGQLKKSLDATQNQRIILLHQSHETLPLVHPLKLVVYNLGYLPKGDKALTTLTETTMKSVEQALALISEGGAVSIMCYPGHAEGLLEENALVAYASALAAEKFTVYFHSQVNRKSSPSFLWIVKKSTTR